MAPRGREFERLKGGSKIILMGSMAAIAAACQPEANPSPTQASEIIPTQTQTTELIIEPTEQPTANLPVWRPPTLEQARVTSEGGEIPELLRGYDENIRLGFSQNSIVVSEQIDFRSTGAGDDYRFAFIARNTGGNMLWAKIPTGGGERFSDYPLHYNLVDFIDEAGNPFQRLVLDTQSVRYESIPDSQNADIVWGGSDGTLPIVVREALTLQDGRNVYSQYWDIATSEWKQVPQLEADLATLTTPEPTVTPEALPTTCLDPEAQARVETEFLTAMGFESMSSAMSALERNPNFNQITEWYGFDYFDRPYWSHNLWVQALGAVSVSLSGQPGFREGDKALCLLAASPYSPESHIPLVIGVQKDNQWEQLPFLLYQDRSSGLLQYTGEEKEITFFDDGVEWINGEMRGKVFKPGIQIRFIVPERIGWYGPNGTFATPLVRNPKSYLSKYSNDPTYLVENLGATQLYYKELGGPNEFDFESGEPIGEQLLIHRLLRDLNRNPGGDIGVYANIINLYK